MRKKRTLWILGLCILTIQSLSAKSIDSVLQEMINGELEKFILSLNELVRQNDLYAQFYLAECYNYGIGVAKDDIQSYNMYRKSAERGLPDAMLKLSSFYRDGRVVNRDISKANAWSERYKNKGGINILQDIRSIYTGEFIKGTIPLEESSYKVDKDNSSIRNNKILNGLAMSNENYSNWQKELINSDNISDIDTFYPSSEKIDNSSYAIIIANENYKRVPNVPYALNDGNSFRTYLSISLGIPDNNIDLLNDATLNDIKFSLNKIVKRCEAFPNELNVIIYYSGHGVPDEETFEPFLLPVDGIGSDTSSGLNINELYSLLSAMSAKSCIVLLDACFSGTKKDGGMLMATRGITIKPKSKAPEGNLMVFSATSNDEIAFPYEEQKHGLFTYTLLKKIQETGGDITWGELSNYVIQTVKHKSIDLTGTTQTPTVAVSPSIKETWKNIKLR